MLCRGAWTAGLLKSMAAFILRTRYSLFANPLREAWISTPSVSCVSSIHLQHRYRYECGTLPRRKHALTTERVVTPSFSPRSFNCLTPTLSNVDPQIIFDLGVAVRGPITYALKKIMMPDPVGIKILPSKPHHAYQERKLEIREIEVRFDQLKRDAGSQIVGVYIEGSPASGKTQLAREFGERYYEKLIGSRKVGGTLGGKAVVATLDARTPASFLRSYLRLAVDLGFPLSRYSAPDSIRNRVLLISIDVQKALAEMAPNWLLIIDGIDPGCKLINA